MKLKVRKALIKKQYNVFDYYHKTGCMQAVAKSHHFEHLTFLVIAMNAVWISIDIDLNNSELLWNAELVFQVVENFFCGYFALELIIRFFAFRYKRHCCQDFWFMFDCLLVLMMISETWVLSVVMFYLSGSSSTGLEKASILRILRLAKMIRISRMVRLLRAVPELVILLKGIGAASRTVTVFLFLWLIIIYVFAIIFRQLTEGQAIADQYFNSVPNAMNTLLLHGVLPDHAVLMNDIGEASPFLWVILFAFVLLAFLTLMYMLIGVLCDVVSVTATVEKEGMTVIALATQLRAAWEDMEKDTNDIISKEEFNNLLVEPEIVRISTGVGVDVFMLMDMADVVFEDFEKQEKDMSFEDFVELMLKMRGGNQATVKDIRESVKVVRNSVIGTAAKMNMKVDVMCEELSHEIKGLAEAQKAQLRLAQLEHEHHSEGDSDDDHDLHGSRDQSVAGLPVTPPPMLTDE